MAARDRFGTWPSEPQESQLKRFIRNACDPANFEPNLALNLEIADLINQKKGTAPREAAVTIVNYINHRNPNVSLLALSLLDICVKNCGYAFHLQISTKDFLNELVRRFPERPPPRPNRVQLKILEAIEEWRGTICMTSRYKDDLGFIRDMHRLLSYKGYTFPEVRREDVAVLNPSDSLKSADEMEEEEREAQSAKLQELIRRGTPADLQEANKLMKIMAGYDQASRTDYRAKAASEIGKLRKKAALLDEMLAKVQPGETIGQQDTFEDLTNALITAQPKIQKMVEEESDDTEAVVKLLELNDVINTMVEKYNLTKKGEYAAARALPPIASNPPPAYTPTITEDSLIDLGGDTPNGSLPPTGASSASALQEDLLGLSIDDPNGSIGVGGGIALGFGANTSIPGPPLLSTTSQSNTAGQQSTLTSPMYQPGYPVFGSFLAPAKSPPSSRPPPADDDEEWAFTSALPPGSDVAPLKPNEVVLVDTNLRVVIEANLPTQSGPILLRAKFSNNAGQAIQDLTLQMAVTRAYSLQMEPQTGRVLQPYEKEGVVQMIRLSGPQLDGKTVKMRWKASYRLGTGPLTEEQGVVDGVPFA